MGLVVKPYTFTNGPSNIIDAVQVNADLDTLYTLVNGQVEDANVKAAAAIALSKLADGNLGRYLGLTEGSTIRRGKSIITTSENRTNAAYGLMTTPDRVQNVVVPTDGLLFVNFEAAWSGQNAEAAIFIGANQLTIAQGDSTNPLAQSAGIGASTVAERLVSGIGGLATTIAGNFGQDNEVTTGQAIAVSDPNFPAGLAKGGPTVIRVAAGTYDVSVQFRRPAGAVNVHHRRLHVWTMDFS